uniref:Large neutral amino acids transporter small subunit 1 n=2 Tax=Bursaphelenchus xylophilus TaxID=6326 RepID=A0A1I7SDP3_BURXY
MADDDSMEKDNRENDLHHEAALLEEGEETKIQLKQRISLFNGCAIIVGVIVGSGIFVSPRGVIEQTGSAFLSLVVWMFCGIFSLLGALCYAELGTTIPKSGGDYTYIHEAFGKVPAFIFLWMALIIVNPSSIAIMALTFSTYSLQPFYLDCTIPQTPIILLSAVMIIFLTFINCYNVRWSTKTQDISSVTKVAALLLIVFAGVYHFLTGSSNNFNWESLNSGSNMSIVSLALAFYQGVFSFSGYNYLNFVTEEIKEPNKNLPRAIYLSIPVVTVIYLLVNMAYFVALTPQEVLLSPAVAVTFANRVMGFLSPLMPFFVAISCIGSVNGIIFTSSRMFFAGARDGQLPELLAMIHVRLLTPIPSLIALCLLSLVNIFVSELRDLINYLSFAETAVVFMSVAALLKLRICSPEIPRPIKFNLLVPLSFLAICLFILVTPFVRSPIELIAAAIIICSGVPVYLAFVQVKAKPAVLYTPWVYFTQSMQKLLLCVTEDEHTE